MLYFKAEAFAWEGTSGQDSYDFEAVLYAVHNIFHVRLSWYKVSPVDTAFETVAFQNRQDGLDIFSVARVVN